MTQAPTETLAPRGSKEPKYESPPDYGLGHQHVRAARAGAGAQEDRAAVSSLGFLRKGKGWGAEAAGLANIIVPSRPPFLM